MEIICVSRSALSRLSAFNVSVSFRAYLYTTAITILPSLLRAAARNKLGRMVIAVVYRYVCCASLLRKSEESYLLTFLRRAQ